MATEPNHEKTSLLRFIVVGGINTLVDIGTFFILFYGFDIGLVPANIIAFMVAVSNSYALNRYWSFAHLQSNKHSVIEYLQFVFVSILTLGLSTSILVYGQNHLPVGYLKFIAAGITPIFNYLLYRFLVFTPRVGGKIASGQ